MKFTRTIALMLTLLTFVGCGSGGTEVAETTATSDTTTAPIETTPAEISDDLPEKDFEGRQFRMITYNTAASDLVSEGETGDVVSDAVYHRNQTVEERFNVTLDTFVAGTWDGVKEIVRQSVLAGDDEYQLVSDHVVNFSGLLFDDLLVNWYDVPYVDFSKPWWSKSTVDDLSYGEVTPFAVGDLALSALSYAYCYYFDKTGIAEYGLEDPYTVVNEGRWTLDYLMTATKDIYKDVNSNNERDGQDFYGVSQCKTSAVCALLWSCGGKVIDKDSSGTPQIVYGDEKTVNIYEKVYKFCLESTGVQINHEYTAVHKTAEYAFRDNLCVFASGMLSSGGNYYRDRVGEYGIIPYPKYDEAQEEYYTQVDGSHCVLAIPKTVEDLEYVGIITEALNAESRKQVFPAYYEVALKVKYSHDNESVQMIEQIADSRIFDMGFIYDNWKGMSFYFQNLIAESDTAIASYIESNSTSAKAHYAKVLNFLLNME